MAETETIENNNNCNAIWIFCFGVVSRRSDLVIITCQKRPHGQKGELVGQNEIVLLHQNHYTQTLIRY